ncbi:MAG: hypothetical protein GYA36_21670 [Veillonellaceae bacterium]|nr:hypothetical protein [Veillonellaceae bacterium]
MASDYEFALDTTCDECGCGVGDVVLSYLALADPADPQSGTVRKDLEANRPTLATSKLNTMPTMDIDIDSDNVGGLTQSRAEDLVEDGTNNVGHRIFANYDDDNKNGIADRSDSQAAYTNSLVDNDLAEIRLNVTGLPAADPQATYELWLGAEDGLNLWLSQTKQAIDPTPDNGGSDGLRTVQVESVSGGPSLTWYVWSLDTYTWGGSTGNVVPTTVYVEGNVGLTESSLSRKVYWRLRRIVDPNVLSFVARDTIKVNVEPIVWPNQETSVSWDPNADTYDWNGFELAEGWYISNTLCEIKNGSIGYIRTEYPELTGGSWQGTLDQCSNATFDLAALCGTETWDANTTVRIELSYEFEQSPNITTGQYVDTTNAKYKEGFFANSGIKIENRAEIQIFDTASLLQAMSAGHQAIIEGTSVTISADSANDVETTQQVLLAHTGSTSGDWLPEYVNALITGIPYRGVIEVKDADNPDRPFDTFLGWLNGAPQGSQVVTIDVFREADEEFTFTVTIDGHTRIYRNIPGTGTTDPGMLYIQSHWGSGVKFTSAKAKKL